jgi:subtilisin family serine protease
MRNLLSAALLCGVAACSDTPTSTIPAVRIPQGANLSSSASVPIPGRYIVQFRNNTVTSLKNAMSVQQSYGGSVERVYTAAINGAVLQLSASAAATLRADPRVLSIEQDQTIAITTVQNNPPSWGLDRIDQHSLPLNNAFSYGNSGSGVTAYIIDTGINFSQADFNGRAVTGYDAITAGGTAVDCNGHGTHTAGTVGSTTYGVAKSVRLVAVRVMDCVGNGTTSSVIAGIDWVTQHATRPAVANMSLGGSYTAALNTAVENSIAAGVSYAISAGNSSADACNYSPASAPHAITVGATTIGDAFASFSNFGSCVKISAPGYNITSLWIGPSGTTNTISGTSMAAPHVAGVAALFLAANPNATPAQVLTGLTSNATQNVVTSLPASTPNLLLYEGFIGGTTATNQPPTATLSAPAANGSYAQNSSVSFTGAGSDPEDGALSGASLVWTSSRDGQIGTGTSFTRNNLSVGTHTITLTAKDSKGAIGTTARTITITAVVAGNQPPVSAFTWSCNTSFAHQCAMSGGTSTDDVAIASYTWDWGNGRSEIHVGANATNTFAAAGTYNVTLKVTDGGGLTNSITKAVAVP